MGGGGSSSTTSQGMSKQHGERGYPEWYEKMGKDMAEEALAIKNRPYEPFEGTVVPNFSNMTLDTLKRIEEGVGQYQPLYNEANEHIRRLMQRGDVQRGNVQDYMNPYVQTVVDRSIDNAERSGRLATRNIRDQAQQARAFGGSRQAVQEGVQQAETSRGVGDLSAKLWSDAYDKGTAAQQADWTRQFQNLSGQKGLAESQAQLAKAAQAGQAQDYFNLLSGGKMLEDKDREKLEEVYKKFLEKRDWDKNDLSWFAGLLNATPVRQIEDITKTESSSSKTKQSGGMDFGSILGGAVSLLGMSDRDTKTNIEKLGTDPKTKLPVYAYDYKADVENTPVTVVPKRVGYMAQDVEKKYPKAVKKIAGKRVIDYTQLPLGT